MAKRKIVEKKNEAGSEDPRRLVIKGMTCGKCDHFKHTRKFDDVCSKLGVKTFSSPCKAFSVSPVTVNFRQSGAGLHLARLIRNAKTSDLDVMAAILVAEKLTRKHGFHYGQRVVIKIVQAGTHLNHYALATIVKADAKYVYVQGTNGFRGQVFHDSVIDAGDFEPVLTALVEAGKQVCPKAEKMLGSSVAPPANGLRNFGSIRDVDPEVGAVEGKRVKPKKELTKARVVLIGDDSARRQTPAAAAAAKVKKQAAK